MSPRSKQLSDEMRAQSQAALLAAGRQVFAEQGFFKSRIADIAHKAGMSIGNVYWYFSSKEELLKAILTDGFDTLGSIIAEAAQSPGTAREKIDSLVEKTMQFGHDLGEFNTIMLSLLGHGGEAYFAQLGLDTREIGLAYTRSLASIIVQGQEEGSIPAHVEPFPATMLFFGLFNGLNLTYDQEWLDLPVEMIQAAVRRLIGVKEGV